MLSTGLIKKGYGKVEESGEKAKRSAIGVGEDGELRFHFSPYQYVRGLGKLYQIAIDATGGGAEELEEFAKNGLGPTLRGQGSSEEEAAYHALDVLAKIALFRKRYPDAKRFRVDKYALVPDDAEFRVADRDKDSL